MGYLGRKIKCAIYTRVSTTDQNCDRQRRDLVGFADAVGYEIVAIHSETASGGRNDRQQRAAIINLARSRKIDCVLVTELSRWGRSTIDLIMTLQELASYGVSVLCQTGMQLDLTTPHGKLIATILASMAEFERELLRERVRSGVAHARSKGKILGRPVVDTRDRCRDVDRLSQQGLSIRSIAAKLHLSRSAVWRCRLCH